MARPSPVSLYLARCTFCRPQNETKKEGKRKEESTRRPRDDELSLMSRETREKEAESVSPQQFLIEHPAPSKSSFLMNRKTEFSGTATTEGRKTSAGEEFLPATIEHIHEYKLYFLVNEKNRNERQCEGEKRAESTICSTNTLEMSTKVLKYARQSTLIEVSKIRVCYAPQSEVELTSFSTSATRFSLSFCSPLFARLTQLPSLAWS